MRLVLDTNILVSIYLYRDARHTPLRDSVQSGADTLLMDVACFDEAAHILRSARFDKARDAQQIDIEALVDALKAESTWIRDDTPQQMPTLPRCRDPDDQKFLHLAARGDADALITYDKALLRCRGRVTFKIVKPEQLHATS